MCNRKKIFLTVLVLLELSFGTLVTAARRTSKQRSNKDTDKKKHKGKKQFFPGTYGHHPNIYHSLPQHNVQGLKNVQFAKGLPPGFDCTTAKYGCCWDGRTSAHGEKGKGCPQCRDVYKDFCKKTKELCHYPMIADYCRITCKLCGGKKHTCQSSEHNCCWDGTTVAKGPKGKGCPKIKDTLNPAECEKFESECLRNPYFMWTKCRESCIKNLPPIQPYLHMFANGSPVSNYPAARLPPYGHHPLPYGMASFPGLPQASHPATGKKTAKKSKHKVTVKTR